jgi:hypothetical protein
MKTILTNENSNLLNHFISEELYPIIKIHENRNPNDIKISKYNRRWKLPL